jgi:hypothetical protein
MKYTLSRLSQSSSFVEPCRFVIGAMVFGRLWYVVASLVSRSISSGQFCIYNDGLRNTDTKRILQIGLSSCSTYSYHLLQFRTHAGQ